MTNITLRAYFREIESIIEQGFHDQAIAHCKHLLGIFPKNVDVYRILGKAYLESQRYGDANDIFQRVLSSIPDDFISHVGMSIIREDEGNLSEAIWHMERAFETQPANSAIQTELKRLYGRRDGVEPPKINLSRGALARMYMKGGLAQQAIAELRTALAEDPKRLDLQTLLARAYYQANQRVAAAEICSNLLDKLPYSYDANQILSELLSESNRDNDAQAYIKRIHSLNPYTAFISGGINTAEKVSESAVIVEKLDYQTDVPLPDNSEQPSWASSLGIQIETEKIGAPDLPVEKSDDKLETDTEKPFDKIEESINHESVENLNEISSLESSGGPMSDSDKLPEWMKDAGWEQSSEENQEDNRSTSHQVNGEPEDITLADIPEWLKSISPQNIPDKNAPERDTEENRIDEDMTWLDEIPPGPTDSIATWLKELDSDKPQSVITATDETQEEETPDWLQEMSEKSGIESKPIDSELTTQEVHELDQNASNDIPGVEMEDAEKLPDWLKEIETHPEPIQDLPEWLIDESEKSTITEEEFHKKKSEAEAIPDWLTLDEDESIVNTLDYIADSEPTITIPETDLSEEDTKPIKLFPEKETLKTESPAFKPKETDAAYTWLESLAINQDTDKAVYLEPEDNSELLQESVATEAEKLRASSEETDEIYENEDDWELHQTTMENLEEQMDDKTTSEDSQSSGILSDSNEPFDDSDVETPPKLHHENEKAEISIDRVDSDFAESDIATVTFPININTAGLNELEKVPCIGFIFAQEIIAHREAFGPFKSPEDLNNIHEISPDLMEVLSEKLSYQYEEASEFSDTKTSTHQDMFIKSRELLERGDTHGANAMYREIIKSNENLSALTSELEDLLSRNPLEVDLWISLGDAYMHSDLLQEALDAYSKAENLIT